ncbi:hypothetical protein [Streptomyces sp. NPDC102462]
MSYGGGLLTCMANTHTPTVPDGSMTNPPPLDEGPKDIPIVLSSRSRDGR